MSKPATATPVSRKRVPGIVLALAGAAATVGYGVTVPKMTMGAPLVVLGLGGMTLVLCALALWKVMDPLLRADAGPAEGPRAPARLRDLEREKQAVLKAIREIELDFQMRKIAEGDHREMTQRYRARAMRIISELDAGDDFRALIEQELKHRLAAVQAAAGAGVPPEAAAATVVPTAACAACGTGNDKDAVFCKKCGGKLDPGAPANPPP